MAQSEKENGRHVSNAWVQERIRSGRALFGNATVMPDGLYETDQEKRLPQPPLFKAPVSDQLIDLPSDFSTLDIDGDFLGIINRRKSHRVYTDQAISLAALAYLLWCTQGVKSVRGKAYATLRTVPGGGARHPFECYMAIRKVEGLKRGLYHYLPMKHPAGPEVGREGKRSFLLQLCLLPCRMAIRDLGASHRSYRQRTCDRKPVPRCHLHRTGRLRDCRGGRSGNQPGVFPGWGGRDDLLCHAGGNHCGGKPGGRGGVLCLRPRAWTVRGAL